MVFLFIGIGNTRRRKGSGSGLLRKLGLWFLEKFSLYTPETSKHVKQVTGYVGLVLRAGVDMGESFTYL